MSLYLIDEQRELDAFLRNDFVAFSTKVFHEINPEKTFVPGWYIRAMARALIGVALERHYDRLVINLPPRALKSTLASVALPAFLLGRDPTLRLIHVSYAQELASLHGRQTRAVMQTSWYRRLFPSTRFSPGRLAEHDFHTTRGGFRLATSTGGTLTGRGGDLIIVDDPLKAADAYSETRRRTGVEWLRSTLFSRLDHKRNGAIIVVQQRLHEEDLSGYLLRAGGWEHLNLPALAERDEWVQTGPGFDRYFRRAGEPLDPAREDVAELEQTRRDLGTAIFEAQYQQSPTPADGEVIKMGWFKRYDEMPEGGRTVFSLDTASKAAEHNDYSVLMVWRVIESRYYLEYIWRERVDYPTLKRRVIDLAGILAPDVILVEDAASGTGLIQDLNFEQPTLPVIAYKLKGDKETRMRLQVAKIEVGQVFLPREAEWLGAYEVELRQFPHGRHDDQVDATSQFLDHVSAKRKDVFFQGRMPH